MIAFYIDTTSKYLYTGIVKDNTLIASRQECLGTKLSNYALLEVSEMFKEVHLEPNDIDKIIVVNGPGSFTGIRIGVSLAKIYAWSLQKEIITISSLEAMKESVSTDKLIVPILNARRNACYAAIFDGDTKIMEEKYLSIETLNLILMGLKKEYLFVSNDEFPFKTEDYKPDILKIVHKYLHRTSTNPHLVNPRYLKLTEAEENKLKEV